MTLSSAILSLLVVAAPSAEQTLRSAIEDFEFGDHAVAAKKLAPLLDPIQLSSADDVILARQYLGACHYLLNHRAEAEAEFSKILVIDPQHKLDPAVFSPALVQFFDEVRARTGLTFKRDLEPPPAKKEEPAPLPKPAAPPPRAAPSPPPFALAFVPFGVGQFNNDHPARGAVFATLEVGLLGTAAATFAMFQSVVDQHATDRNGQLTFDDQINADKAATLQSVFLATFWSAIGVMAIGVTEAIISYPGDAVPTPVAWAPVLGADANGARAGVALAF